MGSPPSSSPDERERERYELLHRLENALETSMVVLRFVWLALLVVELVCGDAVWFERLGTAI